MTSFEIASGNGYYDFEAHREVLDSNIFVDRKGPYRLVLRLAEIAALDPQRAEELSKALGTRLRLRCATYDVTRLHYDLQQKAGEKVSSDEDIERKVIELGSLGTSELRREFINRHYLERLGAIEAV